MEDVFCLFVRECFPRPPLGTLSPLETTREGGEAETGCNPPVRTCDVYWIFTSTISYYPQPSNYHAALDWTIFMRWCGSLGESVPSLSVISDGVFFFFQEKREGVF